MKLEKKGTNNIESFSQISKISAIFEFVFPNLIENRQTSVTLFWNLARNPEKNSSKILRKNTKFEEEIEKIGNSIIQSRKNVDDFWLKFRD